MCALVPSGTRCVKSERPLNDQEKAEGHAQGPGETGEAAREEGERGPTQWEAATQQRLCVLRSHFCVPNLCSIKFIITEL